MSRVKKLNQQQVEEAFRLLSEMWEQDPHEQFLALPLPTRLPENLLHLEVEDWEALSWSLDCLMQQAARSVVH